MSKTFALKLLVFVVTILTVDVLVTRVSDWFLLLWIPVIYLSGKWK